MSSPDVHREARCQGKDGKWRRRNGEKEIKKTKKKHKKKEKKKKRKQKAEAIGSRTTHWRDDGSKDSTRNPPRISAQPFSMLSFMNPLSTGYDKDRENAASVYYRGWVGRNKLSKEEKRELTRLETMAKEQVSDNDD